jgi:Ca2+-binding EF-hand superfamily protein
LASVMVLSGMTQMTDFLERRLARRFRAHDHDGNGFLQRRDFELSAIRMAEEFGHGPESPARQRLVEISLGLWEHLRKVADPDTDGRISLAEYKAAFAAGLLETPESFDQGYVPYINAVIDIADQDGDRKLTVSDEVRWMGSLMGVPEEVAREGFHRIDKDNDGLISAHDLVESIRGYYFDETPGSPAHWLLGPLYP